MKPILALLMLATPTLADHCRVRNNAVVIQSTGAIVTPFAVPVAVPVAVASPYVYQHSGASAAAQVNTTNGGIDSDNARLFAEFLEWRRSKEASQVNTTGGEVKAAVVPQTLLQQNCVKCHTENADAREHFDMSKELTADQKLSAIRAVMTGKMPKAKTLDPQVRADIVAQLSGVKE